MKWQNCRRVVITSDEPWDPYSKDFEENERAAHVHDQYRLAEIETRCNRVVSAVSTEADGLLFQHLEDAVSGLNLEESDDSEERQIENSAENSEERQVASISTENRAPEITEEVLAKRWGIGLETAKRTMKVTTQAGVRTIVRPMERRFRTRRNQLKFPTSNRLIYSDTMFPKVQSIRKMNCAQIYTDTLGWDHFHPMRAKSEAGESLDRFVDENQWIPRTLITDGAMEQKGGDWGTNRVKWGITQRFTEPYSPWQNRAEATVLEMKKSDQAFYETIRFSEASLVLSR